MDLKKRPYDNAVLEIIKLASNDLITTSSPSNPDADSDKVEDNLSPETWL